MVMRLTWEEYQISLMVFGALHADQAAGCFPSLSDPPPHSGKDGHMQATFFWTAYTFQMLAVSTALAHNEHELAAEYEETAREYLDRHFDEIEKHVNYIGVFNA